MKKRKNDLVITIPPMKTPFKNNNLTKEQFKLANKSLKYNQKLVKDHFKKEGAWRLCSKVLFSDFIRDVFNDDLYYSFVSWIINRYPRKRLVLEDLNFYDTTFKVFYNQKRNSIYISKEAKNVNTDVNLGAL